MALAVILPHCTSSTASPADDIPVAWNQSTMPGRGFKAPAELKDGSLVAVNTSRTREVAHLVCYKSTDQGSTWSLAGIIATDPKRRTDIGDAMLLDTRTSGLLCSYRQNHIRLTSSTLDNDYSIRVAVSLDNGATWQAHSTVEHCAGTTYGLWSSFLLEKQDGTLQCYYDDEYTPAQHGRRRHQWLTMKTWDPGSKQWTNPVTVSRAYDPHALSRDGMCSVVEVKPNQLLCAFETVRVDKPHKSVVRCVASRDGGKTWSWNQAERQLIYATHDPLFNALSPWMIHLSTGALICTFVTDEDRPEPDTPSTGKLDETVKAVYSFDSGETWTTQPQTVVDIHPAYAPGIVELKHGPAKDSVFLQFTNYWHGLTVTGKLKY